MFISIAAIVLSLAVVPSFGQTVTSAEVRGKTRNYDLKLTSKKVAPDGYQKVATTVNGQTPGPLLKGNKGDTLMVNVENELTNSSMWRSSSIHWHGIHMFNHDWADGVASVTQCPIIPGNSFQYEVPTTTQAGTFWYHSHFSTQYCEGLRGPLVIYDPNDPHKNLYDVDDESTVITLSDWFHQTAKQFDHNIWHAIPPRSNATLINGQGVAHQMNGTLGSPAIINVQQGKRYRFRLINMACDPHYWWSIDGHDLTIIEADSVETKPLKVDSIEIAAGQRYSFVLDANKPVANYWIRAKPFKSRSLDFENRANTAILRYKGAPKADPRAPVNTNVPVAKNPMNQALLRPLIPKPVPGVHELGHADVNYTFVTTFNRDGELLFWMNNITLIDAPMPTLLQIMSGAREAADLLPKGSLYTLPPNKTVEITLPGATYEASGPHPFHLHGHDFWVVKSIDTETPNWDNAILRDTVSAGYENQSVTIRFRTDNNGPWLFHCHIDWHLERGLGVIFAEDTYGVGQDMLSSPPTNQWTDLCNDYNQWKGLGNSD